MLSSACLHYPVERLLAHLACTCWLTLHVLVLQIEAQLQELQLHRRQHQVDWHQDGLREPPLEHERHVLDLLFRDEAVKVRGSMVVSAIAACQACARK